MSPEGLPSGEADGGVGSVGDTDLAAHLAGAAGRLLLQIRGAGLGRLSGAELGRAGDEQANALILSGLAEMRRGDGVLSEESLDDPSRTLRNRVWIVDPLDGTKEFTTEGRSDWAVHVALWEKHLGITAAAVAVPAIGEVFRTDEPRPAPSARREVPIILISASRPPAFSQRVASELGGELVTMGSAGAKTTEVLRGRADAYIHAGGQWEWDSAAPVGVAIASGLHASRTDGSPLLYNQPEPYLPDLVICRPYLADAILAAIGHDRIEE